MVAALLLLAAAVFVILRMTTVSETSDSTSEQLMTMFAAVALFRSIPVIFICHDPLLESTYYIFSSS